ncbi:RnfABCDGE type electron transport complex subunit D [Halanaerobium sp. Z-7514]|uniref:Ion-translocating oxidoreductase complex subunit D n=1 Tax=Halanaerobium polyolivorans TaxID=2886943 RepID=A0AAW4WYM9_9FIRM|nr:RnfABCDGE type electron transport complex subunit D [Halanaerobium polyolivorans]MCC3144214.1 RnfABCDGE type electron transport complex subunit D [Halanaerobium polyolivorans]RQD77156.1 MAG: RnfABCDGE type electron transport complex subunit D [Halanaerobium sp. MSAO_Bac5]
MNSAELVVTSSPHVRSEDSVPKIMWSVVIALLPAFFASVYFFSARAISIVLAGIAGAVISEYIFQKVRGKKITITDGSAVVTGLLLALTLPPTIPLWATFLGGVVAIVIGKQVFGGIGHNPFNPALIGRAFMVAAYPVLMTDWAVDGVSTATPLALMKSDGIATDTWRLFVGQIGGSLGETSALALLLGFSFLLYKGYVNWRIPLSMISTVFLMTFIFGQNPVFHIFAGGLMIGALYMATDMVSSPTTKLGRYIFGIGAGVIVVVIRLWGGYSEGVLFAILLMNAAVPLINRYTRPRSLGEVK